MKQKQNKTKNNFLIHLDYEPLLQDLTQESKGDLLDALFFFVKKNEDPIINCTLTKMAYNFIKRQIIYEHSKWEKTCKSRAESGSLGGKQKVANASKSSKCKQSVANVADKDKDKDNVKEKENVNLTEKELVSTILTYLNTTTSRTYKLNNKKSYNLITSRIKENYNIKDFELVIKDRTRLWGEDPKMREYLRPSTLFGEKFESYLESAKINITNNNTDSLGLVKL